MYSFPRLLPPLNKFKKVQYNIAMYELHGNKAEVTI